MKRIKIYIPLFLLLIVLVFCFVLSNKPVKAEIARTWYINVDSTDTADHVNALLSTSSSYPPSAYNWNDFFVGQSAILGNDLVNIKDSTGVASTISLANTAPFLYGGLQSATTGNNSALYPDAVIMGSAQIYSASSSPAKVKIYGLDNAKNYNIKLYGYTSTSNASGDQTITQYSIGGVTKELVIQFNTSNFVEFLNLVPVNGEIEITVAPKVPVWGYGELNAIELSENAQVVRVNGDQSRTQEFFVGSSAGQVNSAVDYPFSVYIGDSLLGISNPVKSDFFSISGVYTGGGSLQFKIDSDAATAKTFTLPSVANPTDFSLIYNDDFKKINPSSGGAYNHTLNIIPTGVNISGLGAKLVTTHQFAPTSCVDGLPANQKIKTNEFFVASLNNPINSATVLPFSLYIGDDLSGISNPVKSIYFMVSGVYTGGGNMSLLVSEDGSGTSTSFVLPSVSSQTNFHFIYKDLSNNINPTTAGAYNYHLRVGLSGLTISNLAVKAIESHRYKPVNCASGFPPFGDLISAIYDSTSNADGAAYNSIVWKGALGGASFDQGKVKFQLAASDSSSGPWNYYGGATCGSNDWYEALPSVATEIACNTQFNNKRYFRYKIRICSLDCLLSGPTTPQVDDVIVNWSP